eukprot:8776587-Prorocentrum_lima.AAC.1
MQCCGLLQDGSRCQHVPGALHVLRVEGETWVVWAGVPEHKGKGELAVFNMWGAIRQGAGAQPLKPCGDLPRH